VDPQKEPIPQELQPVTIGEGLPPSQERIGSGQFIKLSELPDSLGAANVLGEADSKAPKAATKLNLLIEWA